MPPLFYQARSSSPTSFHYQVLDHLAISRLWSQICAIVRQPYHSNSRNPRLAAAPCHQCQDLLLTYQVIFYQTLVSERLHQQYSTVCLNSWCCCLNWESQLIRLGRSLAGLLIVVVTTLEMAVDWFQNYALTITTALLLSTNPKVYVKTIWKVGFHSWAYQVKVYSRD